MWSLQRDSQSGSSLSNRQDHNLAKPKANNQRPAKTSPSPSPPSPKTPPSHLQKRAIPPNQATPPTRPSPASSSHPRSSITSTRRATRTSTRANLWSWCSAETRTSRGSVRLSPGSGMCWRVRCVAQCLSVGRRWTVWLRRRRRRAEEVEVVEEEGASDQMDGAALDLIMMVVKGDLALPTRLRAFLCCCGWAHRGKTG